MFKKGRSREVALGDRERIRSILQVPTAYSCLGGIQGRAPCWHHIQEIQITTKEADSSLSQVSECSTHEDVCCLGRKDCSVAPQSQRHRPTVAMASWAGSLENPTFPQPLPLATSKSSCPWRCSHMRLIMWWFSKQMDPVCIPAGIARREWGKRSNDKNYREPNMLLWILWFYAKWNISIQLDLNFFLNGMQVPGCTRQLSFAAHTFSAQHSAYTATEPEGPQGLTLLLTSPCQKLAAGFRKYTPAWGGKPQSNARDEEVTTTAITTLEVELSHWICSEGRRCGSRIF